MSKSTSRGIITKPTRIKRYGSVRCYGATWHASSVLTQRGFRDLPNNVYYSQQYKAAMKKIGKPRYRVINPRLAEQLHGLPKNWTKATFSKHSKVKKLIKHNEDRMRGASLFSGVGALDKGLEHAIDVKLYYEKDAAARRVLQSLIHKGMLSPGEIHGDVADAEAKDHLCIYYAFIFCIYISIIDRISRTSTLLLEDSHAPILPSQARKPAFQAIAPSYSSMLSKLQCYPRHPLSS